MEEQGIVTLQIYFNEEQLEGKGEDSGFVVSDAPNAAIIGSMDGCGGAGSRSYPKADNCTGARLASDYTCRAVRQWFVENAFGKYGTGGKSAAELAQDMKKAINFTLEAVHATVAGEETILRSRLARTLPTTLASILVEITGVNEVRCISFWAGDSRTYIFRADGLVQTSRDDIRGHGDPFTSLENDGILSNLVSVSQEYEIHTQESILREPCLVLTCSDGCFSYFRSPMEFEWTLLDTLVHAEGPGAWEQALRETFGGFASDDYTMAIAVIGFRNWNAIRNAYTPRWEEFKKTYADPLEKILEDEDRDAHLALWNQYRRHYLQEENGDRT